MDKFDTNARDFGQVKYMTERQAAIVREVVRREDATEIIEIGFVHGKSSAYIAAILEDLGRGRLTTIDRAKAEREKPSIRDMLA